MMSSDDEDYDYDEYEYGAPGGRDYFSWTPNEDWRKNWRIYVTNVPECFRVDFGGPHGEYQVRDLCCCGLVRRVLTRGGLPGRLHDDSRRDLWPAGVRLERLGCGERMPHQVSARGGGEEEPERKAGRRG